MSNPTVNAANATNPGSAASQTTGSISVAGNFQLCIAFISGSTVHLTSATDTLGNSYSTVLGVFGNANNCVASGAFHICAVYSNNVTSGTNAVTLNFSGVTGTPTFVFYADCAQVATSNTILTNIYNNQSAVGNGTNVITVSGGTGSDAVNSFPALIVAAARCNSGTISAGTGLTSAATVGSAVMLEYALNTSTNPFDSTASITSGSGSATANSWQFVLQGSAQPTVPYPLGGLPRIQMHYR